MFASVSRSAGKDEQTVRYRPYTFAVHGLRRAGRAAADETDDDDELLLELVAGADAGRPAMVFFLLF